MIPDPGDHYAGHGDDDPARVDELDEAAIVDELAAAASRVLYGLQRLGYHRDPSVMRLEALLEAWVTLGLPGRPMRIATAAQDITRNVGSVDELPELEALKRSVAGDGESHEAAPPETVRRSPRDSRPFHPAVPPPGEARGAAIMILAGCAGVIVLAIAGTAAALVAIARATGAR